MSRKLRNIKPSKVNRGVLEEQKIREEKKTQNQRAMLFILPLVMLAILIVGVFFGYKFYLHSVNEHDTIAPSEADDTAQVITDPMLYRTVSSASVLPEDYVPETTESCGVPISVDAADALEQLVSAASDNGFDLLVREGYISFEEQNKRYEAAVKKYRKQSDASLVMAEAHVRKEIPRAGESEQQTGLVVDLSVKTDGKFADTDAYAWLVRYCVDYGFILRYPEKENTGGMAYSSHLFRYVGKTNAYNMRELDMSFDEYCAYQNAH